MLIKRLISSSLIYIFLTGCLQTENSNSGDGYAPVGEGLFLEANEIFATKCIGCHHTFQNMTEAQLIAAGDVIPGDPEGSEVYYRLNGSSGAGGPKNMPSSGSISLEEVMVIYDWISSIQ